MISYLNNYFYLLILSLLTLIILFRFFAQRKRSEGKILKMIKELEDKLIKI